MGPGADRRGGPGIFMFLSKGAPPQAFHPGSQHSAFSGQGFGGSGSRAAAFQAEQSFYDTVEVGALLSGLHSGEVPGRAH